MISVAGEKLCVDFKRFDLDAYVTFLRTKALPESDLAFDAETETYRLTAPARFAGLLGLPDVRPAKDLLPLPDFLHDYQAALTERALRVKRWASWWDCGLGKTLHALEFARQAQHLTGGRGLILTLNNLIGEFTAQFKQFYVGRFKTIKLQVLKTRAELIAFCKGTYPPDVVGITNYEKFIGPGQTPNDGIIPELKYLSFLVADESSILKSGGGVIKWNLIKSARGIEYKLSCTATPAPNDIMEYASQAGFLEKLRNEGEILWTYFRRNKEGAWEVKPHALEAFYRFMSSWSIYLRNPAAYGYADNLKDIPAPLFFEHKVSITNDQKRAAEKIVATGGERSLAPALDDGEVLNLGVVGRGKLAQIARGFVYPKVKSHNIRRLLSNKPPQVARLVADALSRGRQVLVWTQFDEETAILAELIPGAEVLTGSVPVRDRAAIIARFRRGQTGVLITRAELLGFGQNFQFCTVQIFSGFTDSYEEFYQAVRRSYRYGQTQSVEIHIVWVPELEGAIWSNVLAKKQNFEADTQTQERFYVAAMKGAAA